MARKKVGLAKATLKTRKRVAKMGGKAAGKLMKRRSTRSIQMDRAMDSNEPHEKRRRRR